MKYILTYFLFLVESAPVSPSRSLPNANSVPNLPQQTSSGAFNMPKPATPTIHLTTPLNATKGNAGEISLTYKVYEKNS